MSTSKEGESAEKAHLKKLPVKSFDVAPGDIVGGLVFIMPKPVGIEEGMIGLSVQSKPYRMFIAQKIQELTQNTLEGIQSEFEKDQAMLTASIAKTTKGSDEHKKAKGILKARIRRYHSDVQLQKRFNQMYKDKKNIVDAASLEEKIDLLLQDKIHQKRRHPLALSESKKIFFKFSKLHEIKSLRSYYQNVGMGGLLLQSYEIHLGINPNEKFHSKINKFIKGPDSSKKEDKVYMIKQDGKMVLGGTGPGFRKILETGTGKRLQTLFNPLLILGTGGISALTGGAILVAWRGSYIIKNRRISANSEAIVETVATKMATIRGFESQQMDTIQGTYEDNTLKIATSVQWLPGCVDLTGHISGGKKDFKNTIISVDKIGAAIKVDRNGDIIQVKKRDQDGKMISFEKIKHDGTSDKASQEDYDQAMAVSDDTIADLGPALMIIFSSGDRDALGKSGQNKAIRPLIPPINGKFYQFYGIDWGKAYKSTNPFVSSLSDDFTFDNPKSRQSAFVNISMLYDNPLRDKMQGVYLIAALRGKLTDPLKSEIADEYEISHPDFAQKLRDYPKSILSSYPELSHGTNDDGINCDLRLVKNEIKKYTKLQKDSDDPAQKEEYYQYAKRLSEMVYLAKDTDEKILSTFKDRMYLTPSQIDVLDNLEKLTSNKVYGKSPDGTVLLNHLRVERSDRVAWQLKKQDDGQFLLICDSKELSKIQTKLQLMEQFNDPTLNKLLQPQIVNGKIQLSISKNQLNELQKALSEHRVAQARDMSEFRTIEKRNDFHHRLRTQHLKTHPMQASQLHTLQSTPKPTVDPSPWERAHPITTGLDQDKTTTATRQEPPITAPNAPTSPKRLKN